MQIAKSISLLIVMASTATFPLRLLASGDTHSSGVDLGIGRGADSHRPNILVAWRNTERILEVEVLVRNLGDRPGHGKVWLDLADARGKTLYSTEPIPVSVPAKQDGGDQGTIVVSKGFRLMNLMFDQLDEMNQRYKLRAHIETDGPDLNPLDNIAVKTLNVDNRALPKSTHFYPYEFVNKEDKPISARVGIENTPIPDGWVVDEEPKSGTEISLGPHETFRGFITVKTPTELQNGQYIDFATSLIGHGADASEQVVDRDEWFLVSDTVPPEVSQPTITARPDGSFAVNTVAFDGICGIKEASGVQVAYSLDGGATFSTRIMAYTRGTFYDKTWFEAVLGPFTPGTEVKAYVTVSNNAGVSRRFELSPVKTAIAQISEDPAPHNRKTAE